MNDDAIAVAERPEPLVLEDLVEEVVDSRMSDGTAVPLVENGSHPSEDEVTFVGF